MRVLGLLLIMTGFSACRGHRWHKPPAITAAGDTVYIASFCELKALDGKTGKEKWVYEDPHHKVICDAHRKKWHAKHAKN